MSADKSHLGVAGGWSEGRPTIASGRAMIPSMIRELYEVQERGAKAIPYRVELTDAGGPLYAGGGPASYNDYNGGTPQGRIQTPLSQREATLHLQTFGGHDSVDWLTDAVSFTAQAAASAGYHFMDGGTKLVTEKDPRDPQDTKLAPSTLVDLIAKPNPFMSWEDLCELTLIDFLIVGNAYWVKWQTNSDKQPLALYRMAPQFIRIIPGEFGPTEYRYRLPGQRTETPFSPEQILHFKRPNPHNAYYGLGIVQGGARPLDMEISLTKTTASYYDKQALPSGVVSTERRVPRDVFNKLKSQLTSFYGGGQNAGQLMVLEAGLQYTPISPNAADAGFVPMGQWSRDRILALFNMNKALLGMWESGDNPQISQWQQLFDRKTMMPLCGKLSSAISRGLTQPGWGVDFVIDYEETQVPEQIVARAQALAPLPGVKVHELREAAGLPPSTGDPEVDNMVLNMPTPNLDKNGLDPVTGKPGPADRNLPGEVGRPPLPQNTRAIVPPMKAGGTAAVGTKSLDSLVAYLETLEKLHEVKALAPANVTVGNQLGTPPQDTLFKMRHAEVDSLVESLASELQREGHTLERGLLDAAEGKASGTAYQRIKNSPAWASFKDRLGTLLEQSVTQGLSLANVQHSKSGFDPADIDYETVAKGQVYRREGLPGIVETLKKGILAKVLAAQRAGSDRAALERAIRDELSTWASHAKTVALTELTRAYNEGSVAVAEHNGATHVLVSDGDEDDEPCIQANGQTWTLEEARANSLEHPNCRRAFVPVLA